MTKIISSLQHPLVKELAQLHKSRKEREQTCRLIVEGNNLLAELLTEHQPLQLLIREGELLPKTSAEIIVVTEAVMRKISACEAPPGMLAVYQLPSTDPSQLLKKAPRRLLILDKVSDPGNLGTLLRSAAAFGWEGVYLTPGCVDPFGPKAIRAAKGATFRLPLFQGELPQDALQHYTLLQADLGGGPPESIIEKDKLALILGNEAHGPSANFSKALKVTLPMAPGTESLNVAIAGALLMYLLK